MKQEDKNLEDYKIKDYRFDNQDEVNSNEVLQEYLKIMYAQIKADNKLVGEFSVNGTYTISEPRMREYLIHELKFFKKRNGDEVYITRALEGFELNFKIVFNIVGYSQQAILYIIEVEKQIEDDDIIHTTKLAEIVKVGHPRFEEFVYKSWNVMMSAQGKIITDDFLLAIMKKHLALFQSLSELIGISSQIYLMSMFSILGKGEMNSKNILNNFNILHRKISLKSPNFILNTTNLKKLLDQIMRKQNFFSEIPKIKGSIMAMQDFVKPIKSIQRSKGNIITEKARDIFPKDRNL